MTRHRLPSLHAVLGVVTDVTPAEADQAARRMGDRYRAVPGLEGWRTTSRYLPELRSAVVVSGRDAPELGEPLDLVWGCPVGADGPASDAEVDRALESGSALGLDGVFVLLRATPGALRLVTSAAFVFTLRRSGSSLATRATAALALAGRPLQVDRDTVPEVVVWAAVLQRGELLAGVDALEEAAVVDVTRDGVRVRSYADLGTRLAARSAPSPRDLRDAVRDLAVRSARVPGARLALTSGRDSALVASCLDEAGVAVPSFTMGPPRYGDVRGAKAVADLLGWPHEAIPVTDVRGRTGHSWPARSTVPGGGHAQRLVDLAPWTEGLQHARDALVGVLRWDGPVFPAVSGHSGEVGRAFYWEHATDAQLDADPVAVVVKRGTALHLPAPAKEAFRAAVAASVQEARDAGRAADALDVVYVQRQRSWMDHKWLPGPPVTDVLPVFLAPGTVRLLMDVPRDQMRGGTHFDAAIRAHRPEIREAALTELARDMRPWRLLGPLNPYGMRDDGPLLGEVLRQLAPDGLLVRELLGEAWWDGAVAAAQQSSGARAPLWNAVAVEALHRAS